MCKWFLKMTSKSAGANDPGIVTLTNFNKCLEFYNVFKFEYETGLLNEMFTRMNVLDKLERSIIVALD